MRYSTQQTVRLRNSAQITIFQLIHLQVYGTLNVGAIQVPHVRQSASVLDVGTLYPKTLNVRVFFNLVRIS